MELLISVYLPQWDQVPYELQQRLLKELKPIMEQMENITDHKSQCFCNCETREELEHAQMINL